MSYRFVLEKYHRTRRYTCPACHRPHCYTRYVDSQGEIELPMEYGRCDHESSCGYNKRPTRELLRNLGTKTSETGACHPGGAHPASGDVATQTPAKIKPSFIPDHVVEATMWKFQSNPLYRFLSKVFTEAEAARLLQYYGVGTSKAWGGAAVFWQRDIHQRVRTGKVMGYDPETGHRIKEPHPQMNWAHCLLQKSAEFHLEQCYFGEHLLKNAPLTTTVYIVESEKTALIAKGFCPNGLWIATGGICNLRPSKALKGRPVVLIPDLGAEGRWEQKALEMINGDDRPASVTVSKLLTLHATTEQRQAGWDLADFLLAGLIKKPYLLCPPDHPHYNPFPSKEEASKEEAETVNDSLVTNYLITSPEEPFPEPSEGPSLPLSSFPPLTENETPENQTPKTNKAMAKNTPQSPDVQPNINDNSPLTTHHSPLLSEIVESAKDGRFPIDALPQGIRQLIKDTASQGDFQQEYTAMSMISALASALGNGAEVKIRRGWKVNPAMMITLVGRPGSGKTPPLLAAYEPLKQIDTLRYEQWRKDRDAYEYQERVKAYQEGQEPAKRPKLKQTVLSDFTPEALTSHLESNERGVAIVVDEIAGFFNTVNRYNASNLIENLMTAFSGGSIKVNRKGPDGKGEMVVVTNPSINLVGTIQPSLVGSTLIRPFQGNGFLDRMCIVYPEPRRSVMWDSSKAFDMEDDDATERQWAEMIARAARIPHDQGGCWRAAFSPEALDSLYQFRNEIVTLNDELEESEVHSREMKRLAITAKLALTLHASEVAAGAKTVGDPISQDTVMAAIALNEWLEWSYSRMMETSAQLQGHPTAPTQAQIDTWAFVSDLPTEFTTAQALKAAKDKEGKSRRWVCLKLQEMVKSKALTKESHGRYRKVVVV